jgi:capsular exopolysaccharide synthesis family protein
MASLNGNGENSRQGASLPNSGSSIARAVIDNVNGKRRGEPLVRLTSPVPNAGNLLRALKRRWLLAVILGSIVGCGAAAAVWRFLPPAQQSAYAKLYMPAKVDNLLYHHPEANVDFQAFQKTQVALIKNPNVLETALQRPDVVRADLPLLRETAHPVEWLTKAIRVEFPEGPEIPRISLDRKDGYEAQLLLQAITDTYLERFANKQMSQRRTRLNALKELSKDYEANLKEIQDRMEKQGKDIGAMDPKNVAQRQEFKDFLLHLTEQDYIKAKRELDRLRMEETVFGNEKNILPAINDDVIDEYIENDSSVVEQRMVVKQLEKEFQIMSEQVVRKDHPTFTRLKVKLDSERSSLDNLKKKLRPSIQEALRKQHERNWREETEKNRREIAKYEEIKNHLSIELQGLTEAAGKLNEGGLVLEREKSQLERATNRAAKVAEEIEKLTVELEDPPRVTLLEAATIVHVEESQRRLKMAGFSGAGAFALVLLGVALLEFRSRRIDSLDAIVHGLGMNLMGTLPACPSRSYGRLLGASGLMNTRWQASLAESIDSTRTLLAHAAQSDSIRIVMVASAVSGEGKTSIAAHLAASMARAGYKTLLIDGDLRTPMVHRIFDLAPNPGFSELLRGQVEIHQAVQPTPDADLWVMTAGHVDSQAVRLLARDALRSLFSRLRNQYDFVIVDSSPVLLVADGLCIAQQVDGVLFSIMHHVSRLPRVHAACQRLEMLGVKLLGAVVNGTMVDRSEYGSSYVTAAAK